jgi:hypothetical protein
VPITFVVDAVAAATIPAPTITLAELLGEHVAAGIDSTLRVLPMQGVHPLLAAVHHAFAEHRPLVLSPDALWLTIASGVAQHVRLHGEGLRSRLIRHAGRKTLEVSVPAMPSAVGEWQTIVHGFRGAIADDVGAGLARLLTCDFSTTGDVERTASEIVLMDALATYYDYAVTIICGIPSITLTGTTTDWRSIRERIRILAELDLGFWTTSLAPIVDRLVAAADGRPDVVFFQAIYKPQATYGKEIITGWIARLFPYVRDDQGAHTLRNPLLQYALDEALPEGNPESFYYDGPGISSNDPPAGPSRVLVRLRDQNDGDLVPILLEGGLLAVEQDAEGRLVPRAGWLIRPPSCGVIAVIDRIRSEHALLTNGGDDAERWYDDSELRVLFEAIGEASLFGETSPWHILPAHHRDLIEIAREGGLNLLGRRVIDLSDGSFVAVMGGACAHVAVRLRDDALRAPEDRDDAGSVLPTLERFESIPLLAHSLIDLLARALSAGVGEALAHQGLLIDVASYWWDGPYHASPLIERLRRERHVVVDGAGGPSDLFGIIGEAEIRVGNEVWRVPPSRERRSIVVHDGEREHSMIVWCLLPDGTALARSRESPVSPVMQLHLSQTVRKERKPATKRRPALVDEISTESTDQIAILGRNMVEVLTSALDHGAPPPTTGTLSNWKRHSHDY